MITQITTSGDFRIHRRLFVSRLLALVSSFGLALALAPRSEVQAASITKARDLSAEVVGNPFVLDQEGHRIVTSGKGKSRTVELAPNSVPSYLAFKLAKGATVPSSVPTIDARSGGKLQFTPLVQTQLDRSLAQDGEAVVTGGKHSLLVQPLPLLFGSSDGATQSQGSSHAWRAAISTLHSDLASASGSKSSTTTSTAAGTKSASVATTVQAQTITPSTILDPVAHSKLLNDIDHLLTLKSGKLVNWDQATFNALKSDLSLGAPQNVASKVSTPTTASTTAKPMYEAQVIAGAAGNPQLVPAPEPGTLAIFGLGAIVLVYRLRRGR